MPYAIWFEDKAGQAHIRARLRDEHIAYMRRNLSRALASGGLLSDDGETAHGGLIILDCASRAEAARFVAEDPFFRGGLFAEPVLLPWHERRNETDGVAETDAVPYAVINLPGEEGAVPAEMWTAHEAYLVASAPRIVRTGWVAGAFGRPAGEITIIGANDRADADAFVGNDPLSAVPERGIRVVSRWRKAFLGRAAFI